jgi:hypothetical protein
MVYKASIKRHLSSRTHREVKAAPLLKIWCKAMVAATKTWREGRWRQGGGNPAAQLKVWLQWLEIRQQLISEDGGGLGEDGSGGCRGRRWLQGKAAAVAAGEGEGEGKGGDDWRGRQRCVGVGEGENGGGGLGRGELGIGCASGCCVKEWRWG